MSKYTLKTFTNGKLLEVFEHRTPAKLSSILSHPNMHKAGATDAWGNSLKFADKFEVYDSQRIKLCVGTVDEVIVHIKKLR